VTPFLGAGHVSWTHAQNSDGSSNSTLSRPVDSTTHGRAFSKREGLRVVAVFEENARSTVLLDERAAGAEALGAMLRLGAGVPLQARRDRLARDPFVAGHAKRAVLMSGGRILYAEGGNGEEDGDLLMDDMRHAVDAHERRAIVARLRRGRETKAVTKPGAYIGGRPAFGYRADPATHELVVDEDAAAVVRLVFHLARKGNGIRAIAAKLNADGLGGRTWYPNTVVRVLAHDGYRRKRPVQIVCAAVWNNAQKPMASRRRSTPAT
jgi:DNA invertase Pin-like site-specific DNA recombinase